MTVTTRGAGLEVSGCRGCPGIAQVPQLRCRLVADGGEGWSAGKFMDWSPSKEYIIIIIITIITTTIMTIMIMIIIIINIYILYIYIYVDIYI